MAAGIILCVAADAVGLAVTKLIYDGKTKKNPNAAARFVVRHERTVNRLVYLMLNVVLIIIFAIAFFSGL